MSAHKKPKQQINLIPEVGFENTTFGRILAWILSTFRIIVIITEVIVMGAFLSRFWLDAQNSDLKDKIEEKKSYLVASQSFESEFKDTQKRLEIYSKNSKGSGILTKSLSTIVSFLPTDLSLKTFTFSEEKIDIEGYTPNEKSIQQLIANLQSSDLFEDIGIDEISSALDESNNLMFKVFINLKKN